MEYKLNSERPEIVSWMKKNNLSEDDLDCMWQYCKEMGHRVISVMPEDWRIISPNLICEIPREFEKLFMKEIYGELE